MPLEIEQINKVTNEYWNRKIVDRIHNGDNLLLLKTMMESKPLTKKAIIEETERFCRTLEE